MSRAFSRRRLLQSAAGAALCLPLLEAFDARAAAPAFPKRLVVMYTPNGTVQSAWWPTRVGDEADFDLGEIHAPLAPFKDRLTILKGIDYKVVQVGPGGPHQRGIGALFTARELQEGSMVDNCGSRSGWANGISVDQEVARQIGGDTPLASLELGVRVAESDNMSRISFAGPGRPLPPMNDPADVYARLFSGLIDMADPSTERLLRRRSILDAVQEQLRLLSAQVSVEDRVKLDQHLELVRDFERRLGVGVGGSNQECEAPLAPPELDPNSEDHMPEIAKLHLDLLARAFACDLTRVASLQFSTAWNKIRYPWLESTSVGHPLSHQVSSGDAADQEYVSRERWHAEQLAYLLGRLAEIPEGDGTVLDNTLVVWGNEVAQGNTHAHKNLPFLLAGDAGGALETGRYLEYESASHADLLVAVLQAMGVETDTFGHPDFCTGALSGLLA